MVETRHQIVDLNLLQFIMGRESQKIIKPKDREQYSIFNLKHIVSLKPTAIMSIKVGVEAITGRPEAEDTNLDLGPIKVLFYVLLPWDHVVQHHVV